MNANRNANRGTRWATPAAIFAVGMTAAGLILGQALIQSKRTDRFVTVKGVAERNVEADLAFWSLTVSVPASGVGAAQSQIESSVARVLAFLDEFGLGDGSVTHQGIQVTDRQTQYSSSPVEEQLRYVVSNTLLVRSADVAAVHEASQAVGRLLQEGVPLSSPMGWGYSRPSYSFTRLNSIKPEMIAEATASAREAAEQFARDSGGRVGGIRRANQGVFVILPRDQVAGIEESAQRFKRVRVVSTLEYYLEG